MNLSYVSNELLINGHKVLLARIPANIDKVIVCNNIAVVKMKNFKDAYPDDEVTRCRNVFGVSSEGKVLWQIERAPHSTLVLPDQKPIPNPFVDIDIKTDGTLKAWNSASWSYDVDVLTGKLSNAKFVK